MVQVKALHQRAEDLLSAPMQTQVIDAYMYVSPDMIELNKFVYEGFIHNWFRINSVNSINRFVPNKRQGMGLGQGWLLSFLQRSYASPGLSMLIFTRVRT